MHGIENVSQFHILNVYLSSASSLTRTKLISSNTFRWQQPRVVKQLKNRSMKIKLMINRLWWQLNDEIGTMNKTWFKTKEQQNNIKIMTTKSYISQLFIFKKSFEIFELQLSWKHFLNEDSRYQKLQRGKKNSDFRSLMSFSRSDIDRLFIVVVRL